jgi:uncharacterized membrane protein
MASPSSSPSPALLAGSLLVGTATGLRSQMGMAAVVLGSRPDALPARLRAKFSRPAVELSALGELVVDKLPFARPRTDPSGLVPRLGLGALSSGILASANGEAPLVPAAIGAGAAAGAAFGGMAARLALSRRLPPVVAALLEDLVAVGLAAAAVRIASRPPTPTGREAAS